MYIRHSTICRCMQEVSMVNRTVLVQNLQALVWLGNRGSIRRTYSQYICLLAGKCGLSYEEFMDILQGKVDPSTLELAAIRANLSSLGYDLDNLESKLLFPKLAESVGDELLNLNLRHLIMSLPRGHNQEFVDAIGVNASTLTRWKQGKTKPDTYARNQIAKYFGFSDPEELRTSFLFLGFDPVTIAQKKMLCMDQIERMSKEDFDKLYPALLKLLE